MRTIFNDNSRWKPITDKLPAEQYIYLRDNHGHMLLVFTNKSGDYKYAARELLVGDYNLRCKAQVDMTHWAYFEEHPTVIKCSACLDLSEKQKALERKKEIRREKQEQFDEINEIFQHWISIGFSVIKRLALPFLVLMLILYIKEIVDVFLHIFCIKSYITNISPVALPVFKEIGEVIQRIFHGN